MWSREFLSEILDDLNLGNGHYLIFSYHVPIFDPASIAESIVNTAQNFPRTIT